jgi:hypothetical protein
MQSFDLTATAVIISALILNGSIIPAVMIFAQQPEGSFFTDDNIKPEGITPLPDNNTGISTPESTDIKQNQTTDPTLSNELIREIDPLPEELNMTELSKGHDIAPSGYLGPASKENINTYLVDNEILTGEEIIDVGQLIDNQSVAIGEEPTIVENQPVKEEEIVDEKGQTANNDAKQTTTNDVGGQTIIENKTIDNETSMFSPSSQNNPQPLITYVDHMPGHPATDPPRDFRLFKYIGGDRISSVAGSCNLDPSLVRTATAINPTWLTDTGASCLPMEPAVASNGIDALYTGNHFVTKTANGGSSWSSQGIDYSQNFFHARKPAPPNQPGVANNGGDNDVVYSPQIQKFIWFRQGEDGRFNLAISPDLISWNYVTVEANNFRTDLNLDTVLRNNNLQAPRGSCPSEDRRECNINFWWDYPQIALSDRYLYITTNIFLGCGRQGLTVPQCAGEDSAFYGSVVFRASLADLNRNIVNQAYFQQSQHQYYDRTSYTLGLTQGASGTMYWATLPTQGQINNREFSNFNQIKICSWNEEENAQYSCVIRDIPSYNRDGISCKGNNDNRDWCWNNRVGIITGAWVYGDKVGFLWNVAADPSNANFTHYPYAWVKAAVFSTNGLNYLSDESERFSLASDSEWIQYAFVSPNQRGLGLMAWYGDANSPPGILSGIIDNYSPIGWEKWKWLRPAYSGPSNSLPATNIRLGDYLRVRPYAGSSNLWEGSAYYIDGSDINPTVRAFYVVFGRAADETQYRSISNRALAPGSAVFQVVNPLPRAGEDPSQKLQYGFDPQGRLVLSVTFNRPVDPSTVVVGGSLILDTLIGANPNVPADLAGRESEPGTVTYSADRLTFTFRTDRSNLGQVLCGVPYFELKLNGIRDNTRLLLDGDYDPSTSGGAYLFRYSPPPC